jgi:calnexin
MRFNVAAAAASAAFLVGGVNAEDQKVLKDESSSSSVAESATQAAPELPTFTVSFTPAQLPCASHRE